MKVLWLTNIPSPYRIEFFEHLGKSCELVVLFERKVSKERDASWNKYEFKNFKGVFLSGVATAVNKAISVSSFKWLRKYKDDWIIVHNPMTPTGAIAILFMKLMKISYCIESDGGFAKDGRGVKEWLKTKILGGADHYLSTSDLNSEYFELYGANPYNIQIYPFSSINDRDVMNDIATFSEKSQLRRELEISEEIVLVSVGQFIHRKGFDVLINAAHELPRNIGIYIIGGSPTDEYLSLAKNNKNIHFVPFMQKEELKKYYRMADLFVFPTRYDIWGLVVNEAMAAGLPVITTKTCMSGLMLVSEDNGRLYEAEDVETLRSILIELTSNPLLIQKMSMASLNTVRNHTIEKMVEYHVGFFNEDRI